MRYPQLGSKTTSVASPARFASQVRAKGGKYLVALLAAVIGTTLSVGLSALVRSLDEARLRSELAHHISHQVASIQKGIDTHLEQIHAIRALYAASEFVDRSEFQTFAGSVLAGHRGIQALEWIPRVSNEARPGFEAVARTEGFPDFKFRELGAEGKLVEAARRDAYFPVYFVEPLAGNEPAVGFDIYSDPARRAALEKARDTGAAVATRRIRLVQETEEQFGFLVFLPIYRNEMPHGTVEDRRENLLGFALGVFRIGGLVDETLLDLGKFSLEMYLFDEAAETGERFLYHQVYPAPHGRQTAAPPLAEMAIRADFHWTRSLNVADRTWTVVFRPSPGLVAAKRRGQSWTVLGAGLLLSGMVAAYLAASRRRTEQVQKLAEVLSATNARLSEENAERRRAELALRKSEERYRALYDDNPTMFFTVGADGTVLSANRFGASHLGYTVDELVGNSVLRLFPDQLKSYAQDRLNDSLAAPENLHRWEIRKVRKDGALSWASVTARVVSDPEGERNILIVCHDITERKQGEEALRESQERFRIVADYSPLMLWLTDKDGHGVFFNQEWCRFMGHSLEKASGRVWKERLHPDDRQRCLRRFFAAYKEQRKFEMECRLRRGDGEYRWMLESGIPRFAPDGAFEGYVGFSVDITERKKAEALATRLGRILEGSWNEIYVFDAHTLKFVQVSEGAQRNLGYAMEELHHLTPLDLEKEFTREQFERRLEPLRRGKQDQLVFRTSYQRKDGSHYPVEMRLHLSRSEQPPVFVAVVQDMTEHHQRLAELIHASKLVTLGQMATGVAHELNQPLNIIKMAVESATERTQAGCIDREYLVKKLNRVSAQVERAAGIIDHMQIFGRRPTGEPQEIDPREAVNGALTLMRQQLRLEDIRIETRLPRECRKVRGHAVQLEQVLLNLLRNACDAIVAKRNSPGDPGRVTVVVEDTGPADKVTLAVEDTGGGIPGNVLDRIFEPFFTTKEVGKGTGLGLSISYGIIHDMNGTMEVANTEKGARFTITLPAVGRWTASTQRAMGLRPASVAPPGGVDD